MRRHHQLQAIPILSEASVYEARALARQEASRLGFEARVAGELVLVVSELSTNISRHAGRGELRLQRVDDDERGVGLEVGAIDEGPPIASFAAALVDGWSHGAPLDPVRQLRYPGLGAGLGAVQRFSDELHYEPLAVGKQIRAVRFVHPARRR